MSLSNQIENIEPSEKECLCCLFSSPRINDAMKKRDLEKLEEWGGDGEGYSYCDGRWKLCQCKNCGALLLEYKMTFLPMSYEDGYDNDITHIFYLPITNHEQALEYSKMFIGPPETRRPYKGKQIWFNNAKLCWEIKTI